MLSLELHPTRVSRDIINCMKATYKCGRSPLESENDEARYARSSGVDLMAAMSSLSTVFWSSTREAAGDFFCLLSPKKSPSLFLPFGAFSRAKYLVSNFSRERELGIEILVEVAMRYAGLTRRRGTPLTLNGPEMRTVSSTCFNATTRLPRKRPARMMQTVPGVIEALSLVGFEVFLVFRGREASSAG